MKFILILVVILGLFLLLRAFKKSAQHQDTSAIPRFGDTLTPLIEEAMDLSAQNAAMPFQIFSLAGKLAPHPNKDEVMAAIDYIYTSDTGSFGFGRRVSLTTLRFIGAFQYSTAAQNTVDYLILRGLEDNAVWVRYDAAWVAGILKIQNTDIISKLQQMQSSLNAKDIEAESADDKLRTRVNEFFLN